MTKLNSVRLGKTYERLLLTRDLEALQGEVGGPAGYPGEDHRAWTALTLFRSHECGHRESVDSSRAEEAALLAKAPYLRWLLEDLACDVRLARLMVLGAGGVIQRHSDLFLGFRERLLRLHVPVVTNPSVQLFIDGERCEWREGELWFGDFSKPHWGHNHGAQSRVHIVLDVGVDDRLLRLFPREFFQHLDALPDTGPTQLAADRLDFSFLLPVGFALPGLHALTESALGRVCYLGDTPMVFVNEQPLLKLAPTSDRHLRVVGLPCEAILECAWGPSGVTRATLIVGRAESPDAVVPLELLGAMGT